MKTMMMRAALLALGLVAAGGAFARSDVRDGNAVEAVFIPDTPAMITAAIANVSRPRC